VEFHLVRELLSELPLGWCTYGVDDQMSHYSPNASVPKTRIRYLIAWIIGSKQFDDEANAVLHAILATRISPGSCCCRRPMWRQDHRS
jgi:NAD+ synthase (glutamine-hydrolysing)